MSENAKSAEPNIVELKETTESKPGFLARVRTNAPRILKVAALTGGALLVGGAIGASAAKSKQNKESDSETYDDGFNGTVLVADSPSED